MYKLKDENKRTGYDALKWYGQLSLDTQCNIKNEFNLDQRYLSHAPTWEEFLIETKQKVEKDTDLTL